VNVLATQIQEIGAYDEIGECSSEFLTRGDDSIREWIVNKFPSCNVIEISIIGEGRLDINCAKVRATLEIIS